MEIGVNDTNGNINTASIKITVIDIDETAPSWDEPPENQTLTLGTPLSYDLNASDPSGIDSYWLNDTINFKISSEGIVNNNTILSLGTYWLEISVNDTRGNTNTVTIKILVHEKDETKPTWDETPVVQTINLAESFSYDVNASDNIGIDRYWINDTINFVIDSDALITNVTLLSVGSYWLEIRAYDTSGNYISAIIQIVVKSPLDSLDQIPGYNVYITLFTIGLGFTLVLLRNKKLIEHKK